MFANLEPYPMMKNSGVGLLGKVPGHWEVQRLKTWLGISKVTLPEDTHEEYTFYYLDIGSVATGRLIVRPEPMRFGNSPSRARRVVNDGDTIVSTVRTYLKAIWHAEHPHADLIASTGFAVLTPQRDTFPKFVSYFCQSDSFADQVVSESVGIAYPVISETKLRSLKVCVPPFSEQTAIVRFLDHADRRIWRYIRAKERLIGSSIRERGLMHEYRTRLIADVVTGKLDVREATATLPEIDPLADDEEEDGLLVEGNQLPLGFGQESERLAR